MSWMKSRRMKHETARQDLPGVRVRGARARLQGRSHPGPLSYRARQDPAEPPVGDVRAAPASARDRVQASAPACPVAVHQRVRRLTRWGLAAGVQVYGAVVAVMFVERSFVRYVIMEGPR